MVTDLTISIVNYKMDGHLMNCLNSIRDNHRGLDVEVYVVDNKPVKESIDVIRRNHPTVRIIANDSNVGFARANNQVLRLFDSRYLLILNPDITVFPGTLKGVIRFMDRHPESGIVGCKILNRDLSIQYSCRRYPSLVTILWRALLFDLIFPDRDLIRRYLMKDVSHDEMMPVDWVTGCFMMIRRETIHDIGLMDERYFLYFEDADLCLRANRRWKVYYLPDVHIIHDFQHSSRRFGHLWHSLHHARSAYCFFRKNGFCPTHLS